MGTPTGRTATASGLYGVIIALLFLAGCGAGGDQSDESARDAAGPLPDARATNVAAAVRGVLDRQVDAWNAGDIPGFMEGYASTDTLRFASGGAVQRGWERTLQRYRETYTDRPSMGTLAFTDLEIWPLSDRHAVVFGRWNLSRDEQIGNAGGVFTLIFERGAEGWKIVHDHTSSGSAPAPADS